MAKREIEELDEQQVLELSDQQKHLYEWAEESFNEGGGQVSRFLDFCNYNEAHEATDVVSYSEFLTLKQKFEA